MGDTLNERMTGRFDPALASSSASAADQLRASVAAGLVGRSVFVRILIACRLHRWHFAAAAISNRYCHSRCAPPLSLSILLPSLSTSIIASLLLPPFTLLRSLHFSLCGRRLSALILRG